MHPKDITYVSTYICERINSTRVTAHERSAGRIISVDRSMQLFSEGSTFGLRRRPDNIRSRDSADAAGGDN